MFNYNGNSELIKECVKRANELVIDDAFLVKIEACDFSKATCDGDQIVRDIRLCSGLFVELYKSKNPFSSSCGYFSPNNPNSIFLNTRKLNRSKGSIVSTLIHEMIHYCDSINTKESYGHGDNSPAGKENTAPFYIDNIAESIIDDKTPNFNNIDNANISYYVPWYKRLISWFK